VPAHRRHTNLARSPRRHTTWARSSGTLSVANNAAWDTVDLLQAFRTAGGQQQGVTVARIRLRLAVITAVAANDSFALGVIRGQLSDVGATIAGAPNPGADPYEDWLFHSVYFASVAPAQYFESGANVMAYDIKSMRKLEELDQRLNIVLGTAAVGSFPLQMGYSTSVLLMLP